jgi:hypothetical protein
MRTIRFVEVFNEPIAQSPGASLAGTCDECGMPPHPAFGPVLDLNCSHRIHPDCFGPHADTCTHPTDEERLEAWVENSRMERA